MRHHKAGVKLNRTTSHRNAMFRNMVTSLFKYEKIKTTDVKAKELRRWADHLITLAKKGDLHARRQALAIVREKEVVYKLFDEAQKRYGKISGGYTRIVKIGRRPGDAAPVSMIELVALEEGKKKKAKKNVKKQEEKKQIAADKEVEAEKKEEKPIDAAVAEPDLKAAEVKAPESDTDTKEPAADEVAAVEEAKDGSEAEK
ncbi:MAG: 50S ribosomal protein L17 [Desulfobacteraceae bacterium 4572_123]|nr:MAG: 50S ribosomal protein L17 [Desulfobacteraceae bacterium 4572_123]